MALEEGVKFVKTDAFSDLPGGNNKANALKILYQKCKFTLQNCLTISL